MSDECDDLYLTKVVNNYREPRTVEVPVEDVQAWLTNDEELLAAMNEFGLVEATAKYWHARSAIAGRIARTRKLLEGCDEPLVS